MITQNGQQAIWIFQAEYIFTIATGIQGTIKKQTYPFNIIINKYDTGKYKLFNAQGNNLFTSQDKTIIYPEMSDWGSLPLSKLAWADYNYHFSYINERQIDLYCQKTSDNTYHDFTDIFDGLKLSVHIETFNYNNEPS